MQLTAREHRDAQGNHHPSIWDLVDGAGLIVATVYTGKDTAELLARRSGYPDPPEAPSYHDLHVTTDAIPRTSIFNLPYNVEVTCNRVAGWEAWDSSQNGDRANWRLLGGEYYAEPEDNEEGRPVKGGLRLDVAGFVIIDSLSTPEPEPGPAYKLGDVADVLFAGGWRRATYIPDYSGSGYPREGAWVWPEGHAVVSHVRDLRPVPKEDR